MDGLPIEHKKIKTDSVHNVSGSDEQNINMYVQEHSVHVHLTPRILGDFVPNKMRIL